MGRLDAARKLRESADAEDRHKERVEEAVRGRRKAEAELERAMRRQAQALRAAIDEGVPAREVGSWLPNPAGGRGVTRDAVYKLISRWLSDGSG